MSTDKDEAVKAAVISAINGIEVVTIKGSRTPRKVVATSVDLPQIFRAVAAHPAAQAMVLRAVAAKSNGSNMKLAMGVLITALESGSSPFELEES